ncbi:MAG: hypothetical protein WCI05_06775 [Myxococcales bacterium]
MKVLVNRIAGTAFVLTGWADNYLSSDRTGTSSGAMNGDAAYVACREQGTGVQPLLREVTYV